MIPLCSRKLFRGALILSAFIVAAAVRAQVPDPVMYPELWVNIGQDSFLDCLVSGTDTVPAVAVTASYQFGMIYDSTSRTDYTFTEARRNGNRIPLLHWKRGGMVHMDADVMSYNSRTAVFPLLTGDTLSFYRELEWYTLMGREQSLTNYYALDTLAYSVELVRASDGAVLALLDSLGIMPSTTPGTPTIHGTRPIMAQVNYGVPGVMAGDSAFIGIRLYAHGSGAYNFIRYDNITVALSDRLTRTNWINYLSTFGFGLGSQKRSLDFLTGPTAGDGALDVIPHTDGISTIRFDVPEGGSATIAVYDATGQLVFYPYAGPAAGQSIALQYRFPQRGMYIVALLHDGRLVTSTKVTITN